MEERPYDEIIDETCPSCRQGIPLGSTVCPRCGYQIREEEAPEVEQPAPSPRPRAPSSGFSKPGLGGALIFISGILAVITGIYMAVEPGWIVDTFSEMGFTIDDQVIVASGALTVIFGFIALIGGYFATKRRRWGVAVVGGILGTLAAGGVGLGLILGLIGLVLVVMSRREFA